MNEPVQPSSRMSLPNIKSTLPDGHLDADRKEGVISQADYYDQSHLKPLMVAAPIANFFNKLSATFQIVVVSTFMILMIAIPVSSMYLVYQMTTNSPNFLVIKQQGEEQHSSEVIPDSSSTPTGIRSAD